MYHGFPLLELRCLLQINKSREIYVPINSRRFDMLMNRWSRELSNRTGSRITNRPYGWRFLLALVASRGIITLCRALRARSRAERENNNTARHGGSLYTIARGGDKNKSRAERRFCWYLVTTTTQTYSMKSKCNAFWLDIQHFILRISNQFRWMHYSCAHFAVYFVSLINVWGNN